MTKQGYFNKRCEEKSPKFRKWRRIHIIITELSDSLHFLKNTIHLQPATIEYNIHMEEILKGILNALQIEIVFVDTTHTIRFMNKFAINNYKDRFGTDLVGKSIFNCHNENSKKLILKGFEELVQGKDKVQVFENEKIKEYMIAVRNEKGSLLGYFEIIERI
ncbi:hypothetical protein CSE_01380 [Caldisericum exile AZM16c01]|uniref:PAS domain-containing protein n=2 Tax=Caldisericum exile TaxID=693075 RepID=A0A7U6GDA1_CALEA|nr:hypothetical protein CSE_01380 [Caldisericum exile AZM16c01]